MSVAVRPPVIITTTRLTAISRIGVARAGHRFRELWVCFEYLVADRVAKSVVQGTRDLCGRGGFVVVVADAIASRDIRIVRLLRRKGELAFLSNS
ncbi:MAG: hypothetical protein AB8B50_17685 [Pirellulaceae bacterium]